MIRNNPSEPEPVVSSIGTASIAKNTIYLLGGHWLTAAIRGVYAIVLARMLGPELYGLFNYGVSWYMAFVIFAGLGLAAVLSREEGSLHARKNILSQGSILCLSQFMILWPYFGVMILFRFLGGTDFSLGQFALILQIFWFAFRIPESSSVAALLALSRSSAKGDGKDRNVYLSQGRDLPAFRHAAAGAVTFTLSMLVFVPCLNVPGALISIKDMVL